MSTGTVYKTNLLIYLLSVAPVFLMFMVCNWSQSHGDNFAAVLVPRLEERNRSVALYDLFL